MSSELTKSQATIVGRLFSSTVFSELARNGTSPLFSRLFNQITVEQLLNAKTVGAAFDSAFNFLRTVGLRSDHVYRVALTQKILLGRHSLRTACMLSEFRTGKSRADIVILNGSATAYEIKSERDSLARLESQIADYYTFFPRVCVVCSESKLRSLLTLVPQEVGILLLSGRHQVTTVREPTDTFDHMRHDTVFDALRSEEIASILNEFKIAIPSVPSTKFRSQIRQRFQSIDVVELHRTVVATLKISRSLRSRNTLVSNLPSSLSHLALTMRLRKADHARLINAMSTPVEEAMFWG